MTGNFATGGVMTFVTPCRLTQKQADNRFNDTIHQLEWWRELSLNIATAVVILATGLIKERDLC